MKLLAGIALITTCLWSSQQEGPKVEIYLLKNRIPSIDNENWPSFAVRHFYATKNDIQDSAFISDTEILGYDTTLKNIRINKSAALKIASLEPEIPKGIQFVLTVNKEPILNGYFINRLTPEPVISYMIMNWNDTLCHIDRLLPGLDIDDRKNKNLIEAFKSTNRLQ